MAKTTENKKIENNATNNYYHENGNFKLFRELRVGQDGKTYANYKVYGLVRGREKKVDFIGYDKGGYEVLEIIFELADVAELIIRTEQLTIDDKKRTITIYEACNYDEDGTAYVYRVKPMQKSDEAILQFIMQGNKPKNVTNNS